MSVRFLLMSAKMSFPTLVLGNNKKCKFGAGFVLL